MGAKPAPAAQVRADWVKSISVNPLLPLPPPAPLQWLIQVWALDLQGQLEENPYTLFHVWEKTNALLVLVKAVCRGEARGYAAISHPREPTCR